MSRWLLLATALCAAIPAHADSLEWLGARLPNGPGNPWPWHLDGRKAAPAGLPLDQVEPIVRGAFQKWQDVSCAYVETQFAGRDTSSGPAQNDGVNLIGAFIESRTEDDELYETALGGGAAIAVSLPLYYGGTIYGCEVAFNAVNYAWSAEGEAGKFDLPTLAVHETGHCLGLDHYTGDAAAVMYPFTSPGEVRSALRPHDVDNLCQIYPQDGQVGSPCASGSCGSAALTCIGSGDTAYCSSGCEPGESGGCPVGFSCKASNAIPGAAGACVFGGETVVQVGAPCTRGNDCGPGGLCFAQDAQLESWQDGYCTSDCSVEGCPASSSCYDDLGPSKYCLKDCRPGMGDCRAGYACEPLASGGGRCRPACTSDGWCGGSTCRACDGLCVPPGAPAARVGDACWTGSDCPTGSHCRTDIAGGVCTQSCGTSCGACPAGAVCMPHGTTGELLCAAACETGADCRGGFGCFEERGVSGCLPGCSADTGCPLGRICVEGSCLPKPPPDAGCAACDGGSGSEDPADAGAPGASERPPEPGCGCSSNGAPLGGVVPVILMALRFRSGRRPGERDE